MANLNGRRFGEGKRPIGQPGHSEISQVGEQAKLQLSRFLTGIKRGQEPIQKLHFGRAEHGYFVVLQPPGRADRTNRPHAGETSSQECGKGARREGLPFGGRNPQQPGWELDDGQAGVIDQDAELRDGGDDNVSRLGQVGPGGSGQYYPVEPPVTAARPAQYLILPEDIVMAIRAGRDPAQPGTWPDEQTPGFHQRTDRLSGW